MNKWLDGKKTMLGGIAGILTTLSAFCLALQDGFQLNDLVPLGTGIAASLAVLGLGGKANKIVDAIKLLAK